MLLGRDLAFWIRLYQFYLSVGGEGHTKRHKKDAFNILRIFRTNVCGMTFLINHVTPNHVIPYYVNTIMWPSRDFIGDWTFTVTKVEC